jgi:hypothetical protein
MVRLQRLTPTFGAVASEVDMAVLRPGKSCARAAGGQF